MAAAPGVVSRAAQQAAREETARIVGAVVRITGDWELAEDCVQDAFARALQVWARDGVPDRPGAWLTTVARNRAVDHLRHVAAERRAVVSLGVEEQLERLGDERSGVGTGGGMGDEIGDEGSQVEAHDRLSLLFTCCHPALPIEARVALTLRTVAGLSVAEIARAFLVSEATMQKRLVRARARIAQAGIPYRVPPPSRWGERLEAVESVLYLLFSEGYSATEHAELVREPLAEEAIRLARMLAQSLAASGVASPLTVEPRALVALTVLQHARRRGRVGPDGDLIPLERQSRAAWDRAAIDAAVADLEQLTRELADAATPPGFYFLQAAIAGCHAVAPDFASTDFARIASLYGMLARVAPSPVVDLNRAVAIAMADGPQAGLARVDALVRRGELRDYYLLPATRADLLRRLERDAEALEEYRRALELAPSDAERRYLRARLDEVAWRGRKG